jgi:hypothetical protein
VYVTGIFYDRSTARVIWITTEGIDHLDRSHASTPQTEGLTDILNVPRVANQVGRCHALPPDPAGTVLPVVSCELPRRQTSVDR